MKTRTIAIAVLALADLTACGGDSGTPTDAEPDQPGVAAVSTLDVSPATATISAGGTQQFTAILKDAAGNTLTGRTVTWSSSDMAMTSRRSGGKSSGKPSVPQPHGGALVPGAGRPPSRIRHALRQSFEDRIRLLEEIADGAGVKTMVGDRLRAINILAKYGLGADRSHHDEELVGLLAQATAEVFAGDPRLEELHEAWVRVIGGHVRGGG